MFIYFNASLTERCRRRQTDRQTKIFIAWVASSKRLRTFTLCLCDTTL